MQIEECFLEMICHSRWVFNYCLSRLDPRIAEEYADDLAEFRTALEAISLPHTNVNEIVDVPSVAVEALCKGVCYLLLGEEVLGGNAPTTMHQFLRQTKGRRLDSAKQAQIITIRWFVNAGLLQIEELLQVIYGDKVQLSDYASDYEAQVAVAEALSTPEPFYLGAHVSILRALLLQYCSTIITADDIVSHVLKVDPSASAELYTLEDTLLFWLKSILKLSPSNVCDSLSSNLSDIYLHTNDGRLLSLVVHYYQPAALSLDGLHLDNENTTITQRQENWSRIISAAESLGLWVGVFSSEVVTHGFATLQLHVLRIVEELFAILAVGVENSYKEILDNLGVSRPDGANTGGGSLRASAVLRDSVRQSLVVTGGVAAASASQRQYNSTGPSGAPSVASSMAGVMSANHHDDSDYPQADTTIAINNTTIMTSVCSREMDHSTAMVGYDPNNRSAFTDATTDRIVVNDDDFNECSEHITAMMSGQFSPVPSIRSGGGGNNGGSLSSVNNSTTRGVGDDLDTLGPNRGESSSVRRDMMASIAAVSTSGQSIPDGSRGGGAGTVPSTVQSMDGGTDVAHRTNVSESIQSSESGGGGYNIILTNMFLQGVSVPVHAPPAAVAPPPMKPSPPQPDYRSVTHSPPPAAHLGSLGSVNAYVEKSNDSPHHSISEKQTPRFDDTQELSAYVRSSANSASYRGGSGGGRYETTTMMDESIQQQQPTTPRNRSSDNQLIDGPLFADSPSTTALTQSMDEPTRGGNRRGAPHAAAPLASNESPTRMSTNSKRNLLLQESESGAASPSMSLTASLAQLHKSRISRSSMNALSHSLQRPRVQGSIDEDGIGDLIAELKTLSRQPAPQPPLQIAADDDLALENKDLRAALIHQKNIVAAFIAQFQHGLQNQKQFDIIANHLAASSASPLGGGGKNKPVLVSTAVGQSFAGDMGSLTGKRAPTAPLSLTQQQFVSASTSPASISLPTPSVEMLDDSTATTSAIDDSNKPLTHGKRRVPPPGTLVKQSYNKLPAGLSVNLLESQQRRESNVVNNSIAESVDNPTPLPALKKVPTAMRGGLPAPQRLAPPAPTAFDVSIDTLKPNKGGGKPPPAHILERLEAGVGANKQQQHGIIQQRQMVRGGGRGRSSGAVIKIDQNTSGDESSIMQQLPPLQQHQQQGAVAPSVRTWNNKTGITLALRLSLLPGSINKPTLDNVLGTMEDCIANNDGTGQQQQFVVLLKDEFAHIFRGLYVLKGTGQLTRIFGSGPSEAYVGPGFSSSTGGDAAAKNGNNQQQQPKSPWSPHFQKLAASTAAMHPRFFKFDTSNKKFLMMPHTEANNTTDAITFSKISKVARERW